MLTLKTGVMRLHTRNTSYHEKIEEARKGFPLETSEGESPTQKPCFYPTDTDFKVPSSKIVRQ